MDPEAIPPDPKPLSDEEFKNYVVSRRVTVVDLRPTEHFVRVHLPGSINIPATNPNLVVRLMYLLHPGAAVLFVGDDPVEAEEVTQMVHRTRRNPVVGWYDSSISSWAGEGDLVLVPFPTVDLTTFRQGTHEARWTVVDVREPMEWVTTGVVPGATLWSLRELHLHITELPPHSEIVTVCAAGGRAVIAASLLRAHGLKAHALFPGGVPHLPPDERERPQ
ncbi:MAG: rhodanese-like domain-containing protein [Ardenticatenia bacterium]|nr:rhodanese-like domain-containing protein [Ardenticatenia bacterium]